MLTVTGLSVGTDRLPLASWARSSPGPGIPSLLDASDLTATGEQGRLRTVAGSVPAAGSFPDGCVFRNRCPRADSTCTAVPPWAGADFWIRLLASRGAR